MMSAIEPYGGIDPNSQHQLWSRWTFFVVCNLRLPSLAEVRPNFARWLRAGFGSVGRARVDQWSTVPVELRAIALQDGYAIQRHARGFSCIAEVEGRPAHDEGYVSSVWRNYERFVEQGFGAGTYHRMTVKVLAGDRQDGKPADQLLVMPRVRLLD